MASLIVTIVLSLIVAGALFLLDIHHRTQQKAYADKQIHNHMKVHSEKKKER